jgi:hypothetical protein
MIFPKDSLRSGNRYEIVYTAVDEKPEWSDILLKILVGERGFELPTPSFEEITSRRLIRTSCVQENSL